MDITPVLGVHHCDLCGMLDDLRLPRWVVVRILLMDKEFFKENWPGLLGLAPSLVVWVALGIKVLFYG